MEAVTRENMADFNDILFTRDWDKVDFSRFSLVNAPVGAEYRFGLLSHDKEHN